MQNLIRIIFLATAFFLSTVEAHDILFEAKGAYFLPTDSNTREIYHNGGLYSLEASYSRCSRCYVYSSAGYLYSTGKTKQSKSNTALIYVPLSVGLKYIFTIDSVRPYLGAGPLVSYVHTKDDSSFVVKIRTKWGIGAIIKTGVMYEMTERSFIDFFVDYSFMNIDFKNTSQTLGRKADISGLSIGGGLGVRF